MRRAVLLVCLLAAGCGSTSPRDLPAPAGPPASPPLTTAPPAAQNEPVLTTGPRGYRLDRANDRLIAGRRSAATCREPVAVATLDRGRRVAVLCGRERVLEIHDAKTLATLGKAGAGIGPTKLATDGVALLYVVDSVGESLLVYHLRPFELIRRVHLGGGPYAIAYDKDRWALWITLNGRNQVVEYAAGNRPVLRGTYPSLRNAREVYAGAGDVLVQGPRRTDVQLLRPRSR
jgi:hypothetical protein